MAARKHLARVVVLIGMLGLCASCAYAKLPEGVRGIDFTQFIAGLVIGVALGIGCAPWAAVLAAMGRRELPSGARGPRLVLVASALGAAASVGAGVLLGVAPFLSNFLAMPWAGYLLVLGPPVAGAAGAVWVIGRSASVESSL